MMRVPVQEELDRQRLAARELQSVVAEDRIAIGGRQRCGSSRLRPATGAASDRRYAVRNPQKVLHERLRRFVIIVRKYDDTQAIVGHIRGCAGEAGDAAGVGDSLVAVENSRDETKAVVDLAPTVQRVGGRRP